MEIFVNANSVLYTSKLEIIITLAWYFEFGKNQMNMHTCMKMYICMFKNMNFASSLSYNTSTYMYIKTEYDIYTLFILMRVYARVLKYDAWKRAFIFIKLVW